ncbi:MAG: AgmX/PglI C-terminal domain-containing protein [Myxococcota bacterium]
MLLFLLGCAPASTPPPEPPEAAPVQATPVQATPVQATAAPVGPAHLPITHLLLDNPGGPDAHRDILDGDAASMAGLDEALRAVRDVVEVTLPVAPAAEPHRPVTDEPGEATPHVAAVLAKHRPRVQACVEQSGKALPEGVGRVAVELTIEAGRVTSSALIKNTTGDDALGQCVVRAARTMRFADETTTTATWGWRLSEP